MTPDPNPQRAEQDPECTQRPCHEWDMGLSLSFYVVRGKGEKVKIELLVRAGN